MAWLVDCDSHPLDIHVMPLEDLRDHWPAKTCWCHPEDDELDEYGCVVMHQSMDGRERHESGAPLH